MGEGTSIMDCNLEEKTQICVNWPINSDEQLQLQEHERVCRQLTRNKQPPRCGTSGCKRH